MALSQLLMAYASKGCILFTRVSDWGMAFHAPVVGLPVPYSGAVAVLLVDNSVKSYRSLLSESELRGQSAVPFCPKAVFLPSTPTYIERTDVPEDASMRLFCALDYRTFCRFRIPSIILCNQNLYPRILRRVPLRSVSRLRLQRARVADAQPNWVQLTRGFSSRHRVLRALDFRR